VVPILRQWKEQISKDEYQIHQIKEVKSEKANTESIHPKINLQESLLNTIISALKVSNAEQAISKIEKLRKMTKEYRGLINKAKLIFHLPLNVGRPSILRIIYKAMTDQSCNQFSQTNSLFVKTSGLYDKNSDNKEKSGKLEMNYENENENENNDRVRKSMPIINKNLNSHN